MIQRETVRVDVLRNGATLTQLQTISAPIVDCIASAEIKTSMSGLFRANDKVNWLTDELQPVLILDGVEHPVGVFQATTYSQTTDANGSRAISIEAYDRTIRLKQMTAEQKVFFRAKTNYMTAIEQLMTRAGIIRYIAQKTTETLATDREWLIGTDYLTIINQLLTEINYGQVYFDQTGTAIVEPIKEATVKNIKHFYSVRDKIKVLRRPSTVETDAFDAPNVFILICNNPDMEAPLIARATNDNPISSISTIKRGRRITKVIQVDNVPNQEALQTMANTIRNEAMMTTETAKIETANLPGHGVYDVVSVVHPDLEGVFQEIEWNMILEQGAIMTHTLRRVILA